MHKTRWVVDNYTLQKEYGDRLKQAFKKFNISYKICTYVPFTPVDKLDYSNWGIEAPTILYGSYEFVKKCPKLFMPGAYGLTPQAACNIYMSYIPLEWFLNRNFLMSTVENFYKNPQRFGDIFSCSDLFIRPNSGNKLFAGFVSSIKNVETEIHALRSTNSILPEDLILINEVQNIIGEYRFIIGNRKVISGSQYKYKNVLDIRTDFPVEAERLAKKVADYPWQMDTCYTCDIAITNSGPFIIELNSFACAGFYACNIDDIVLEISEIANLDFSGGL